MSHDNPHSPVSSENVAEFLADREGLVGGARVRFRRLLDQYGGFREKTPRRNVGTLILVSSLLALTGFVWDDPSGWRDTLVWAGYGLLSTGLIWRHHLEAGKVHCSDRETEWQAYCLFLRPVILSDHPGLLDRNTKNDRHESARSMLRPIPIFRNLVHGPGLGFWRSAMVGLWCGMVALLITHATGTATNWILSLAFPAVGILLGVVVWMLGLQLIYVFAKSDSRLVGR